MAQVPARFDRAQLDRILQRAAELQAGERDPGGELTREELLALGRDVGIPGRFLEQAILEEQTRQPAQVLDGFWDKAAGPAEVGAMRVIRGEAAALEGALVHYIEEHETLTLTRQTGGRLLWEPASGFRAGMRRLTAVMGGGHQPFLLARADSVGASFTPLEPGYVHVALTATVREARGGFIGGAIAATSVGLAGGIAAVALGAALLAPAPLALGIGIGYGVLRRYPPVHQRVQLGLERALDMVERGEPRPPKALGRGASVVGAVVDEVRKALR